MAIDANDVPFTLHVVGDITDKTWSGEFAAKKRLSHRDHLRKDQIRRELLGGQPGTATERALTTAEVISELRVRLTKWENWWDTCNQGLDLEDDNVIGTMYNEVTKIEADAQEARKKKAEKIQAEMRAEAEAKAKAEAAAEAAQ